MVGCNIFTKLLLESGDLVGRKCVGLDVPKFNYFYFKKWRKKIPLNPQNFWYLKILRTDG